MTNEKFLKVYKLVEGLNDFFQGGGESLSAYALILDSEQTVKEAVKDAFTALQNSTTNNK